MKATSLFAALACFFIFLTVEAQSSSKEQFTGAILWEVSGNGLSKPSYILGTHHLINNNFINEIPGVEKAIENSEQIVGEIVLKDAKDEVAQLTHMMMLPQEYSYTDLLDKEDYSKLNSILKKAISVGLPQVSNLKPATFVNIITIAKYNEKHPEMDFMNHVGLDQIVQDRAMAQGKPVIGLETMSEQIDILYNKQSIESQISDLTCLIRHPDEALEILERMDNYYKSFDLVALENLVNENNDLCASSEEAKNIINKDRNDKWLEKLPQIMSDKPSFVAVGCIHLAGKDGLLYRLSEMGYKVTPVL